MGFDQFIGVVSSTAAGVVVHPPSLHRSLGAQWSGAAVQDLSASDSGGGVAAIDGPCPAFGMVILANGRHMAY